MPTEPNSKTTKHIACLDGIRGMLAMWVFWGHICILVVPAILVLTNTAWAAVATLGIELGKKLAGRKTTKTEAPVGLAPKYLLSRI